MVGMDVVTDLLVEVVGLLNLICAKIKLCTCVYSIYLYVNTHAYIYLRNIYIHTHTQKYTHKNTHVNTCKYFLNLYMRICVFIYTVQTYFVNKLLFLMQLIAVKLINRD